MLTENTTFLLFCVECIHNTGKANTSVCLDIKQTFSYYVANVPWWLRLGWAFVKYHFWLWWSILLKEELDIPKKTIDLPQFTDKLDLINWTSLRKPLTCHSSLTNLISSTGHPWENHRPATVHWQTRVVWSTPGHR